MTYDPTLPRILDSSADPFTEASQFTQDSNQFVKDQIDSISQISSDTLVQATNAISALSGIGSSVALPEYNVTPLVLPTDPNIVIDIPDIDPDTWGHIGDFDVTAPAVGTLPTVGAVTVPEFAPTPLSISIPEAPVPENITTPGNAPVTPVITYPSFTADITLPDKPELTSIRIPAFSTPAISSFSPSYPEFSELNISTLIDWNEPVYTEQVIDEVKAQLTAFFAGGSGIDPNIEDSIFARGRDREDRSVLQQEQQATEEWAAKGFTAPPGMLVKRLDNIREEGLLKKLGFNREMTIKVFDTEVDNLRFAVQQGVAAEQLYVTMFLANVERLFQVQRFSVEWQIQLYNISVQVYQARMEQVKIEASVYETQIRSALIEVEVFKALIEGEQTKANINKTLIDAYTSEIGARESMVRIYTEQVKAASIQADIFSTQMDSYKGEIEAYATRVGADKNRFDAYASQIRGEGAKADILATEARAYQSNVEGIKVGVDAEVASLDAAVKASELDIRNYEATVRGLIGRAQVQLSQIEANVAGNNANTQRFIAEMSAEEAHDKVQLAKWEATNRTNIEKFKADITSFQAKLDQAVKKTELLINAQNAAGGLASTITAGALSAAHVGASLNSGSGVTASGTVGYSSSSAESVSCSTSNSSSVVFEASNIGESGTPCLGFTE